MSYQLQKYTHQTKSNCPQITLQCCCSGRHVVWRSPCDLPATPDVQTQTRWRRPWTMRVDLIQQDRKKRLRSLAAPALTSNHGWRSRGNLWTFVNLLFLVSVKFVSRLHTNYWSKALEMPEHDARWTFDCTQSHTYYAKFSLSLSLLFLCISCG